mmetsp:Transcript_13718/g.35080  ORF Transcript_13718/g.35080 Transcript_13718/m.35080 type:complete len:315 (-) Transcript_13718:112-1056(-)|eukprot:CAMPEP_0174930044 /NCGR_PEP_ID=MMETSP1355-20121228/29931_1 /TAXON_ID=464990 /ORGANISM="Hemiselmis tepida, Strain CCMP443" /LENGTH=314 /DNA_ID=CAMNT_0016176307 /DNA_START=107 /DNA_END=1051 /DNA_ORIENTATION=+
MMEIIQYFTQGINREKVLEEKQQIIDKMPLDGEELDIFLKDSEEIRAEPELGGLGPGLTGEYTLYSFVVCRNDKRWVVKKRYSQFSTFDQQLANAVKDAGGREDALPEFPAPRLFGKMSPSFVRERQAALEEYLQALVKDADIAKEPVLRVFLRLPMDAEQATDIENAKVGDGLLTGYGGYKSLYQRTREEKARGMHHTQKKELFAGPPTLAGAGEVGEAFAHSSQADGKDSKKWVFSVPLVAQFGGSTVQDVFGDDVKGLHSTYNNQIKKQVEKSSAEADGPVMTSDGYSLDDPSVKVAMPKKQKKKKAEEPT